MVVGLIHTLSKILFFSLKRHFKIVSHHHLICQKLKKFYIVILTKISNINKFFEILLFIFIGEYNKICDSYIACKITNLNQLQWEVILLSNRGKHLINLMYCSINGSVLKVPTYSFGLKNYTTREQTTLDRTNIVFR